VVAFGANAGLRTCRRYWMLMRKFCEKGIRESPRISPSEQARGFRFLLPTSQNGGHHTRVAMRVHNRDHPQRFFVGRVGDQIFAHDNEPQRPRGEVRAPMAAVGKRHHGANGVQNFGNYPVGRVQLIRRDIVPNLIKVVRSDEKRIRS
jgi:hypothetical protein